MMVAMRHCLVTGGLGFIGSTLARTAAARGARVTVVDNLLAGCGGRREHLRGVPGNVRVVEGDARDRKLVETLVEECDVVFSLAGKTSHIESMEDPDADLEHNVRTALATLEAVRERNPAARVIYASTRQVYGVPQTLPVSETHPTAPVDVNGIHKLAAEWYHRLYASAYGLSTISLRLTNTYGPRQLIRHNRQGFMGWFVRLALEGRPITVYGDGSQQRDLLFVDDAVEALLRVATADFAPGDVLNVPGSEVTSLARIAQLMCEISGKGRLELVPYPNQRRAIDIGDFFADGARLKELIGWSPATTLVDGLRRTFDYFRPQLRSYLEA